MPAPRMTPDTILVRANFDLKRLPLDALEAFVLSQLDGHLTLAEVGEIAGLATERATKVAARLVELGAAEPVRKTRADPRAEVASRRPPRIDPRAEKPESVAPRPEPRAKRPSVTMQPTKEPRRRSTRSLRAARVASPPPALAPEKAEKTEPCEIDPEMQLRILSLEALAFTADYYTLLGVARDADRKDIKRAYFALASKLHPDRFFGKKLGHVRVPLERLFVRLTEANDMLGTKARRAEYDATLAPESPRRSKRPEAMVDGPQTARISKRPAVMDDAPRISKRPGAMETPRSSKRPAAMAAETPRPTKRPSRRMSRAMRAVEAPKPTAVPDDKFRRLQAAGKMLAAQARSAPIVVAGEERLRANDIIGAANNFRLALEIFDDADVRKKLDAIDGHSRDLRHDASIARARICERGERWGDAAEHYIRANQARADAATAERAANALRISNGDLRLAATLAEQAVNADESNVEYRITLGEVYLASGFNVRAASEIETVISRAPQNARARALEARIKARS